MAWVIVLFLILCLWGYLGRQVGLAEKEWRRQRIEDIDGLLQRQQRAIERKIALQQLDAELTAR